MRAVLVEAGRTEVERLRVRHEVIDAPLLVDLVELGVEIRHVDRRRRRPPPSSRPLDDLGVGSVVRVFRPGLQIGPDVESLGLAGIVARDDVAGVGDALLDEIEGGAVPAWIRPGP